MSIYNKLNQYAFPVAYYAVTLHGFEMTPHAHSRCEIMYIISGECTIYINDTPYQLKERQFVFIDQNIRHCLSVDPEVVCSILNFEFTCLPDSEGTDLNRLADEYGDFHNFLQLNEPFMICSDSGKVSYALKDLIDELEKKKTSDSYLLNILFIRLMIELTKCFIGDTHLASILHIRKAKQYIVDHLYEDINVAMVASHVGINHCYLQTLFSVHLHSGIMNYINNLRMDHAAFLLKNSNMSITNIAFHVGYNSRQHFSYTFEKHYQMGPRQYRKLNGQNLMTDTGRSQWMADTRGRFSPVYIGNAPPRFKTEA